mmetsp:Transcript_40984/g.34526  ORF Transcript_40984/g.34526 Transcript_40984/m.34526 type:complete len:82 (+) Transcript_40984:331-576(+)
MFCFVGNKIDMEEKDKKVTESEIKEFAGIHGRQYFLMSAKESMNVNECFSYVVDELLTKHDKDKSKKGIQVPFKNKKSKCC